jgi:hypothetical protein
VSWHFRDLRTDFLWLPCVPGLLWHFHGLPWTSLDFPVTSRDLTGTCLAFTVLPSWALTLYWPVMTSLDFPGSFWVPKMTFLDFALLPWTSLWHEDI